MLRLLGLPLIAIALAACGGEAETEPAASPPTTAAAPAGTSRADRAAAPDIRGTTLDGRRISLADYRGKKVIVNLWSSW